MGKRWRVRVIAPTKHNGANWQIRYYPPPGKGRPGRLGKPYQRSSKTRDETAARALAASEEARLNGDSLPLPEVLERFLEHRAAINAGSHRTLATYRQRAARLAREFKHCPMKRKELLELQERLAKDLAARTVNQHMTLARAAWEWALSRELVSDPWPSGIRRLTEEETDLRPCTVEELERILQGFREYAGGYYYPIALLLSDTGARITETTLLEERHLDRRAGTIRFENTKGNRTRTVCASPEVLELVPVGSPWCFTKKTDPAAPMHRNGFYHAFRAVLKRVGLDGEALSPHSLRRSWITDSLREGVAIGQSMLQTGHSTTAIHLAYRRNAPSQALRSAHEAVRRARKRSRTKPASFCGGSVLKQPTEARNAGGEALSQSECSGQGTANPLQKRPSGQMDPHTARQSLVARLREGEPGALTALQILRTLRDQT